MTDKGENPQVPSWVIRELEKKGVIDKNETQEARLEAISIAVTQRLTLLHLDVLGVNDERINNMCKIVISHLIGGYRLEGSKTMFDEYEKLTKAILDEQRRNKNGHMIVQVMKACIYMAIDRYDGYNESMNAAIDSAYHARQTDLMNRIIYFADIVEGKVSPF